MATAQTYFYVFDQNNSGGYFVKDENVAPEIIIEATEKVKAIARLEEILNQKAEYTRFCHCCGERWYIECPDVYTRYWVSDEQHEKFEAERDGHEAMFYPLEGNHRLIPWSRYNMHHYLPSPKLNE